MPRPEKIIPPSIQPYVQRALIVWLYIGWFGCVYAGKYDLGIAALIFPAVGWGLFILAFMPPRIERLKVLLLAVIGMAADSLALKFGLLHFNADADMASLPLWLMALWLLFAPALFLFKKLFGARWWLAIPAGAIAGPLSYKSGTFFGVLTLAGRTALIAYAIFWALYLPLAIRWIRLPPYGETTGMRRRL